MITLKHLFFCLAIMVASGGLVLYHLQAMVFPYYTKLQSSAANHTAIQPSSVNMVTRTVNMSVVIPKGVRMDREEPPMKTLVWYDFYHFGHGLRNKGRGVSFALCPHKNCLRLPDVYVESIEDSTGTLKEADAVIFQGIHYANMNHSIPRRSDQIFVFAERESGYLIGCNGTYNDLKFKNVFNWTMTFRKDSDVPLLYGSVANRNTDAVELLTQEGQQAKTQSKEVKHYDQIFADKDLGVVWLVSHCNTRSLREEYVYELQKHIQVDIIGACGKNTCPKKQPECKADIIKRYKFILSFENTFQTDYVTEKLFDWFPRDIIQVVFGLADYSTVVPAHTVIEANDFASPKHLAEYLKDVGTSREKYISYLSKKDKYFAVGHTEMQQRAYCKLCEMLNNVDSNRKTYPNIAEWWQRRDMSRVNSFVAEKVTRKIAELHHHG